MVRLNGSVDSSAVPSHCADDERVDGAVALAADLLVRARVAERRSPARQRRRTARLARPIRSPSAKDVTCALTDEVSRVSDDRRATRHFAAVIGAAALSGFAPLDRVLLPAGGRFAPLMPGVVMPLVRRRLRAESSGIVVPAEDPAFARYSATRRAAGVRINVNVLGEAILGESEARRRLDLILARLARPDVDYVSVKISAICPNVSALAFDATVAAVSERLRELFRAAAAHEPAKFVNLDMEEYRDVEVTVEAFERVLDEPEFAGLEAGIVLQAYLPDAHVYGRRLAEWALTRRSLGRGRVKIRVVKGANLAMEHVDAEIHGWPPAPYGTKAEVDASYKALLDLLLDQRYDDAVRIGLASHNLFEAGRFRTAVAARHTVSTAAHRTQDRSRPVEPAGVDSPFHNEPDTDFTRPANRAWLAAARAAPQTIDAPAEGASPRPPAPSRSPAAPGQRGTPGRRPNELW